MSVVAIVTVSISLTGQKLNIFVYVLFVKFYIGVQANVFWKKELFIIIIIIIINYYYYYYFELHCRGIVC
jgi:hypothetical protein